MEAREWQLAELLPQAVYVLLRDGVLPVRDGLDFRLEVVDSACTGENAYSYSQSPRALKTPRPDGEREKEDSLFVEGRLGEVGLGGTRGWLGRGCRMGKRQGVRANLIPIFVHLHAAAVKMEDGNRRGGMGPGYTMI